MLQNKTQISVQKQKKIKKIEKNHPSGFDPDPRKRSNADQCAPS